MKKITTIIVLFIFTCSNAQTPLEKGKIQFNAGFGSSGWGTPLYIGVDYGITEVITCGIEASYQSYTVYDIKSTIIGIQANGNYHFNKALQMPTQWDLYAGLNLNYYNWNISNSNSNLSLIDDKPFGIGAQIGVRYFFTNQFAIHLEAGGGNATSGGKIGITYKL